MCIVPVALLLDMNGELQGKHGWFTGNNLLRTQKLTCFLEDSGPRILFWDSHECSFHGLCGSSWVSLLSFSTPFIAVIWRKCVMSITHTHTHTHTHPSHSFSNPLWSLVCARPGQWKIFAESNRSLFYGYGTFNLRRAFTSSDGHLGKKKLPGQRCPQPPLPEWVPCGEPFTLRKKCDHLLLTVVFGVIWIVMQCIQSTE